MSDLRNYPAFPQFPVTGPHKGLPVPTAEGRVIRALLTGLNFSARLQISGAVNRGPGTDAGFTPPEHTWVDVGTLSVEQGGYFDIPAPARWARVVLDSGTLTHGVIEEDTRAQAGTDDLLNALGDVQDALGTIPQQAQALFAPKLADIDAALADTAQSAALAVSTAGITPVADLAAVPAQPGLYRTMDTGRVYERVSGVTEPQRRGALEAAPVSADLARRNLALAELGDRGGSDGPQFVDGSRWRYISPAAAALDGTVARRGLVVAAADGGHWAREFTGLADARWMGVRGDGAGEADTIREAIMTARDAGVGLRFPKPTSHYNVGAGLKLAGTGNGVHLEFDRGAQVRSTATDGTPILKFEDVGADFTLRGGTFRYNTAPAVRQGPAAIMVSGDAVTDLLIEEVRVLNAANFALWVLGTAASGSHGAYIRNITTRNTLGDGVHVENFDHSVVIDGVQTENNGDDAVAVICCNRADFYPHPTPTRNVVVSNVTSLNPTFAGVKLQGVDGAAVTGVTIRGGAASGEAVGLQLSAGTTEDGYTVPNRNIVVSGLVMDDLAYGVFGVNLGPGGSYLEGVTLTDSILTRMRLGGIKLQGGSRAAGEVRAVQISNVRVSCSGTAEAQRGVSAQQIRGLSLRDVRVSDSRAGFDLAHVEDLELSDLLSDGINTAGGYGMAVSGCVRVRLRGLRARDTGGRMTTGIHLTSNDDLRAAGGCEVTGNTGTAVNLGGNVGTEGWLDEVHFSHDFAAGVAAGQSATLPYPRPVLGARQHITGGMQSTPAVPWSAKFSGLTETGVEFGAASNGGCTLHLTVRGLVA